MYKYLSLLLLSCTRRRGHGRSAESLLAARLGNGRIRAAGLVCTFFIGGCGGATTPNPADPNDQGDPPGVGVALNEPLSEPVFPVDNWWNVDVSDAPVDAGSGLVVDWICRRAGPGDACGAGFHPDFGPPPYGIPYVVVPGDQPLVPVAFTAYGDESDSGAAGRPAGYPIPAAARNAPGYVEGGVAGGGTSGDRHLLVVDRERGLLFETWATSWDGAAWTAGSGAVFDLGTNARRPEGWTSADAAGLAILPGLLRWDEVHGAGEIPHALRVTLRASNGHVWPASHSAGSDPQAPPLGARLRLRASFDDSGFPPEIRKIFRAFKTYGLIVADNGSDLYVQGTMDARWDNDVLNPAFAALSGDDLELVELGWRP